MGWRVEFGMVAQQRIGGGFGVFGGGAFCDAEVVGAEGWVAGG